MDSELVDKNTDTKIKPRMWNPLVSSARGGGPIICATCGHPEKAHRTIGVYPVYCPESR